MALEIIKTAPIGVDVMYWKVMKTNIDWGMGRANIGVAGFLDKKARAEAKDPIICINFQYETPKEFGLILPFQFTPTNNVVEKAYELIKKEEYFTGAKDLL